jgi:hypothetical protein
MQEHTIKLLSEIAGRLSNSDNFMAHALQLYQQSAGLNNQDLAQELGTSQSTVLRLALCKRPESGTRAFACQVQQIADYTGINIEQIFAILEQVEAVGFASKGTESQVLSVAVAPIHTLLQSFGKRLSRQFIPLLASVLIIALTYSGIVWWNQRERPLQIAVQSVMPNVSTNQATNSPGTNVPEAAVNHSLEKLNQRSTKQSNATPVHRTQKSTNDKNLLAEITVDLEDYSILRTGETRKTEKKLVKLPKARLRISFRLPEGNLRGLYQVSIVDAFNEPLLSRKAWSANGKKLTVILDASKLDASESYRLSIAREGEAPSFYQVAIE